MKYIYLLFCLVCSTQTTQCMIPHGPVTTTSVLETIGFLLGYTAIFTGIVYCCCVRPLFNQDVHQNDDHETEPLLALRHAPQSYDGTNSQPGDNNHGQSSANRDNIVFIGKKNSEGT